MAFSSASPSPIGKSQYLLLGALLIVTLVGTHFLDDLLSHLPLPESIYTTTPTLDFVRGLNGKRVVTILFLGIFCVVLDRWRGVDIRHLPAEARALLIAAIGLQTYSLGVLDYNHYFNNWMIADRLLLAGLGILAIGRPLFIPLFVIHLVMMTGQLRQPQLIGYDHVHKFIFPHILSLVWCYLAANCFLRIRKPYVLLVPLIMVPLSLWYIAAGIGKLEMDWPNYNSLYNLFAAAVDAGWLEGWSVETKRFLASILEMSPKPLLWLTILIEILFPVLLFANRTTAIIVSLTLMIFHLAVYLFSGILFWQWSLLELVFIYFLLFRKDAVAPLFTWRSRITYWLLLLLLPFAVHIGKLAWYDCGFINSYTFYLVDGEGNESELDATYFSPYDTGFAKNRFYFLSQQKTLANTYGQCNDLELVNVLSEWTAGADSANLQRVEAFRNTSGMARYDTAQTTTFKHFLTTFIQNKNAYDPELISHFSVPPHMQQADDQRNLQVENLVGLKIVYREKVVLPDLKYHSVARDSFYLALQPE
ncbi:MAG: hypothetical protein WA952_08765 [Lewinella sp.]